MQTIYESAFKEEFEKLEKIAFLGFKKKKTFKSRMKKANTWKKGFAKKIKIKIDEYNLGERLSTGFARIILKKGF